MGKGQRQERDLRRSFWKVPVSALQVGLFLGPWWDEGGDGVVEVLFIFELFS